jgi:hypothetical protein
MVRGENFTAAVDMVVEQCCNCGLAFAMTADFRKRMLDSRVKGRGTTFYCPAGHPQWYTGETEADKLRRERDRLKQNQAYLEDRRREAEERADHQAARARGYKGHAAKLTKRAKAGVCPCCQRSFENLRRHMEHEHPKFGEVTISTEGTARLIEEPAA